MIFRHRKLSWTVDFVDSSRGYLIKRSRLGNDGARRQGHALLDEFLGDPSLTDQIVQVAHHFLLRQFMTGFEFLTDVHDLDCEAPLAPGAGGIRIPRVEVTKQNVTCLVTTALWRRRLLRSRHINQLHHLKLRSSTSVVFSSI